MNIVRALWLPLVIVFCSIILAPLHDANAAEPLTGPVEIHGDGGTVLLAADQIATYDWPTHTLTLVPGAREKLAAALIKDRRLVSGVPFTVAIGGKPAYSGRLTSVASSISMSTPVIVIDHQSVDAKLPNDRLPIQLGYPTAEFFRGPDPRNDPQLRAALRATSKLAKAPPEYTQWIADSLLEMQSIKPGMTRADLLRIFEEEGGLSTRQERRYAYRDCPYIKVNVRFEPVEELDDKLTNHPHDKITSISQPFLEWTIAD